VTNYMLTDKWTVGTNVNVHTGRAYTPIIGVQPNPYFDNHILPVYGEAYSKNLPTYVRLDLRVKRDANFGRYQGNYTLDIYNLLNRENVTNRNLDYKRTTSPQNFTVEDQKGRGIMLSAGVSITF
jgi:hypothetical protein